MEIQEIMNNIEIKPVYINDGINATEVKGCYIGDLLSNVMANSKKGDLWLTVQTHQNVVAIAHLLNMAGIVFVEGHKPSPETIERAKKEEIPLFLTNKSAFEIGCSLYALGLGRD